MKAALVQLNSGDDPAVNLSLTADLIESAAEQGAEFVLTPEVTNCVSASRARQNEVLQREDEDQTLAALRALAAKRSIWLLIGSLALKTGDADGRFANRSFLVAPDGSVTARYDKIHMFDVTISDTESYRESTGYRPGKAAVLGDMGQMRLGMTICYDLRFPRLYRQLAQAGAHVLSVPSAFSPVTGAAHWETLLRARAIETGCYVLAPAQCGTHTATRGKSRRTYGHSLAVAPWGKVVADGGADPGVTLLDLDMERVAQARDRIPALDHDRPFGDPE
ncbi:carbon-nitrogen hydrolase family protein [Roseovarius spongiae]|uniref:Carbon-nitrogen hydrolase family protein n=1 Tax=Roseovarius spongiae TaxID=2320272 RepID=A0A3A8B7W9_9RHOB|nr:carbon-nitrogen hydrolase family protein [Roseovarius spongiae]RKF13346.1 carbon-nitrogen hydrolase family protein [Roseovarius spongiae]